LKDKNEKQLNKEIKTLNENASKAKVLTIKYIFDYYNIKAPDVSSQNDFFANNAQQPISFNLGNLKNTLKT